MKKWCTYKITNNINGKTYFGKSYVSRIRGNYWGSGPLIKAAIQKYGKLNFTKEILEEYLTEEEAFEAEKKLIPEDLCYPKNPNSYNLQLGGYGGHRHFTVHRGEEILQIPRDSENLQKMIEAGWKKGSGVKTNRGMIYIHKEDQNMMIDQADLPEYEKRGWIKGRIYFNLPKDRVRLFKDRKATLVLPGEVEKYLKDGWSRHKPEESRKITITDGTRDKQIYRENLQNYEKLGWTVGSHKKSKIRVVRERECILIPAEKLEEYQRDGWIPGNPKVGMKAMHRGTQLTYVYPEKIGEYEKEGWILGAFKKKH